jgi:hypothetical protein
MGALVLLIGCRSPERENAPSSSAAQQLASATPEPEASAATAKSAKDANHAGRPRGLHGCPQRRLGPDGVLLECEKLSVKLMELQQVTAQHFLQSMLVDGRSRGRARRRPLRVGEEETPVVETWIRTTKGERLVLSAKLPGNKLATCDGKGELTLQGKQLVVPDGCEASSGDTIRCGRAELHWRDGIARSKAVEARFEKTLAQRGTLTKALTACTVLGQPARCRRYVLRSEDGSAMTVVVRLPTGPGGFLVQCSMAGTRPARFPPPCDQVMGGSP